jgi:phosphomannomutase
MNGTTDMTKNGAMHINPKTATAIRTSGWSVGAGGSVGTESEVVIIFGASYECTNDGYMSILLYVIVIVERTDILRTTWRACRCWL